MEEEGTKRKWGKALSRWADDCRCCLNFIHVQLGFEPQPSVPSNQCDQIWRNLTQVAKFNKCLGHISLRIVSTWQPFEPTLPAKISMLLGKFSLLQMNKYWKIILSSGYSASNKHILPKSKFKNGSLVLDNHPIQWRITNITGLCVLKMQSMNFAESTSLTSK